jgi:hypothetical protein
MPDRSEILKEEYIALRREIENASSDLSSLERNTVIAAAAIYTWLLSADNRNIIPRETWYIPSVLSMFAFTRCISLKEQLHRLGDYVRLIEREFYLDRNNYARGWEGFFEARSTAFTVGGVRFGSTTCLRFVFWFALILVTALLGYFIPEFLAHEPPPGTKCECFIRSTRARLRAPGSISLPNRGAGLSASPADCARGASPLPARSRGSGRSPCCCIRRKSAPEPAACGG